MSPPPAPAAPAPAPADDHGHGHGGGQSTLVKIAIGIIAITGAYMIGGMFFGEGTASMAQGLARASAYLREVGTDIMIFFTLNKIMIWMAIGLAAMTGLLFLWKKLL